MRAMAERLESLIGPVVAGMGYELVGVEFIVHGRSGLVRVYIDTDNGITLNDCERVSYQVSGLLDVEDPISGHYRLEVSSPGLDRPLFHMAHFERFAGHDVRVRLIEPLEGRRNFRGVLRGVEDNLVILEQDGRDWRLPLELIKRARLIPQD